MDSSQLVLEVLPYLCLQAEFTIVGTSAYVTALRKKVLKQGGKEAGREGGRDAGGETVGRRGEALYHYMSPLLACVTPTIFPTPPSLPPSHLFLSLCPFSISADRSGQGPGADACRPAGGCGNAEGGHCG